MWALGFKKNEGQKNAEFSVFYIILPLYHPRDKRRRERTPKCSATHPTALVAAPPLPPACEEVIMFKNVTIVTLLHR